MSNNEEALRYPVGKFAPKDSYTIEEVRSNINRIENLPAKVEAALKNFTEDQLNTHYREGGWTIRQVVHHMADSHMNAYIRFKWTLTENTPTIKAYDEKAWAETPDIKLDPTISLNLLKSLHVKWVSLLKELKTEDLSKEFIHPETQKHILLSRLIALYAWHGEHHLGHINLVANRK